VFDPRHIFTAVYEEVLKEALGGRVLAFASSSDVILRTGILKTVQSYFISYFETLAASSTQTSAAIHVANLQAFHETWSHTFSEVICFCCMRPTADHRFPCGHSICETCIQVCGAETEPWTYRIRSCFFCKSEWSKDFIVAVKPPTRGVSVLCLDGGGTRGIIPLTLIKRILEQIRKRAGLSLPFPRYFRLFAGVSSGIYGSFVNLAEC
jgi:hypothetical protein